MSQRNYQAMGHKVGPGAPACDQEVRVLVIGKTGNGKSAVCNTILGRQEFQTGRSMSSTTLKAQQAEVSRHDIQIKVVDTPDVTNSEMETPEIEKEVSDWKIMTWPWPSVVLLAVRCDVRYTAEEYEVYKEFTRLWGDNSFKRRLVVAFTFGDRQDRNIAEELKTVCGELKSVLKDASDRYIVFNNEADDKETAVNTLLTFASSLAAQQSCDGWIYPALLLALVLITICCIVLAVLQQDWPAIGVGIFGIVLALALLARFMVQIFSERQQ